MNVIVFGVNHRNTLGLVRSLGEGGHYVYLLLVKGKVNYVAKSKYVKKCVYIARNEDIVAYVKGISTTLRNKPLILTSGDAEASIVDKHYEELCMYAIPEGGTSNNDINIYRDKNISNNLAQQVGFPLPKTVLYSGGGYFCCSPRY